MALDKIFPVAPVILFEFYFYLWKGRYPYETSKLITSNPLVKYNGTVRRLKPCKIKIEGAWEARKRREQEKPC